MRALIPLFLLFATTPAWAGWPDHVALAQSYEDEIVPSNNSYGTPSSLYYDSKGALHAKVQCGGYAAILLKNAYSKVTSKVLTGLTGSSSPSAKQWNDAIEKSASYKNSSGTFQLSPRATVDAIVQGDILAAEYTSGTSSGHVMIVSDIVLDSLSVTSTIPGQPNVERWLVGIHDGTSTPHGTSDTRYRAESASTDDTGIGNGELYLYADQATGVIVGWSWSTISSSPYQMTDSKSADYRPLVAGVLTGPGL